MRFCISVEPNDCDIPPRYQTSVDEEVHRQATRILLLFLFFFIPGLIYLVWGMGAKAKVYCLRCHAENATVPITTEAAESLLGEHPEELERSLRL